MSFAPEPSHRPLKENNDGKHHLNSKWVLWFLKADRNRSWEECLKKVAVLDTVEDFWGLYSNIQPPSGLPWGSDYYLFREGIKPMWEDEHNVKGGRWLAVVEKHKRQQDLDRYWLETLLALVGEQFGEFGEEICGGLVNIRQKGDKVALWTRDATKDTANYRIGQVMHKALGGKNTVIRYEAHKDVSGRTGSMVKPRIILSDQKSEEVSA